MKGNEVTEALKKKFRVKTDRALAQRIGITVQAIQNWKNRKTITARQIAGLVSARGVTSAKEVERDSIRPVVEFFRIQKCPSLQGVKYELFKTGDSHPYRVGVRRALANSKGVYIFFDSRGQAIYAGKAQRQTLWKEMNLAFNRDRGQVQKIKRVSHPEQKVKYRTNEEKDRQITDHFVPLHDLASYFSAYEVTDGLIGKLEAMLVRSFANDLLNIRMERFSQKIQKNKKVKKAVPKGAKK